MPRKTIRIRVGAKKRPEGRFGEEGEDTTDNGEDGGGSAVEEDAGEVAGGVGEQLEDSSDLSLVGCGGID